MIGHPSGDKPLMMDVRQGGSRPELLSIAESERSVDIPVGQSAQIEYSLAEASNCRVGITPHIDLICPQLGTAKGSVANAQAAC
jgi:hypothetical protein